jgi:glycosyltransferase involved in cell wall biosynthesis
MTSGMPVVTTAIGATGLDVTDGEDIMIAESADDLAQKVVDLLKKPSLYWKIVKNAKKLIEARYDWEAISKKLNTTYEETAKKR